MISLELPHVSVLTKCDLLSEAEVDRILDYGSASYVWDLDQERNSLLPSNLDDVESTAGINGSPDIQRLRLLEQRRRQRNRLTDTIGQLLDDWQMVSFVPLNLRDEDSMDHVFATVNHCIQYGEDQEVRTSDPSEDFQADGPDN